MIDWARQCAAVIPCFNEAGHIAAVVRDVRRFLGQVIVMDDGSTDQTAERAEEAGATVIRLGVNRGKGSALRAGWNAARAAGCEWALALDGDGQHSAEDIPAFFARAAATPAKLVVGNRMGEAGKIPLIRRWANWSMSRCVSRLAGVRLPDSQCGFRLIHLDTALSKSITARRFVIESETLVAFLKAGERVEFVPIQVIYGTRQSRICPWRDTWRWLRWWTTQTKLAST